ncbi:tumor necrosis factor receptor superfamily member 4 [Sphaeramia orbicularis]|uniref:Tumor necrosis factor receptor superfamily member 4-like n=1 Tax=Sphaeramia orbicularis TaxID=375764 RepID=A0A672ZNL7_9TELE|nr:tumor necrosis factor receptor superfamily member 4-like [Sphaeramia orbicularis]
MFLPVNMTLLKLIIFIWTFYGLIVDLEAIKCPKGQGRMRGQGKIKDKCEVCAKGYFQSKDNHDGHCDPCRKCNEATGSMVVQNCTTETNTKCQCPEGSEKKEKDSVTCKCHIGHGLNNGECVKCKDGYFSDEPNSPCRKWSECPSGVKENGTTTKNVICRYPETTADPTSNSAPSFTTLSASTPQLTKTTAAPLEPTVTTKDKDLTSNSSYTGNHIGMVLIILGIIGLLILTALTCKLRISTCMQRKTKTRDSLCRKPVEESGEESGDSSLTSLKQNPEEP